MIRFLIVLILCLPFSVNAQTKYTPESVEFTVRAVFADLGIEDEMLSIARCESRLNNLASVLDTNKKMSVGIFQLNGTNAVEDWDIPYNNAKKARELYLNGGYKHWKNCSLKIGLPLRSG